MANQIMPNIEDFVDSTPLLDSPGELRSRAAEQGYLFFRSLLDTVSVLELRRQILAPPEVRRSTASAAAMKAFAR